jgi:hypothetical protein
MGRINVYNVGDLAEIVREKDPRVQICGEVWLDHKRNGEFLCFEEYMGKNLVPTEGLNHLLNVGVGATAKEAAWYCGIFKGSSYTPAASNTAATTLGSGGLCTECLDADYDTPATNRPAYTMAAASGGVITNSASKAEFTINASISVYGAFIASSQAKTATTGVLLAIKAFTAARAVIDTDILYVTYSLTATSS